MAYCSNCGSKLIDGAKFCQKCGHSIQSEQPECSNQRHRSEFVGKIYKCPNCGELLGSFTGVCPSCGYELRATAVSSSMQEFSRKLEAIEAHRERKPSKPLKERVYGEEITSTDEQKINLIRSFVIPNTKEDLYEFLILAGSNIDTESYNIDGTMRTTDARLAVSDAWKAKFEQAYQKAKLLFAGDQRFEEIQALHSSIHVSIKKAKSKSWKEAGIIWGIFIVMLVLPLALIGIANSQADKKENSRLESIVSEIELQLENGEYKHALMKANTLVYTANNSDAAHQWDIEREYWIDRIIEAANEHDIILEHPADTHVTEPDS